MNSFIVGVGEIGESVREVISAYDEVEVYDIAEGEFHFKEEPDVLHVCFPYSEDFILEVNAYIKTLKPWHVIIWSTLPVGITKKILGAVHSPVEGRHPKLTRSIKDMVRWIGANDKGEAKFFEKYFRDMHIPTYVVGSSDYTEFLKLQSTSNYGINLVYADYVAKVAKEIGMNYNLVRVFNRDYNKLYHNLGIDWAKRYILKDPHGHIGGHCIRPNAELLDEQFPHELLKMIGRMQ